MPKTRNMMWATYRRGPSLSVPSPFDGDHTIPWHYDFIAQQAQAWAQTGFTDVLYPPVCKTNAGPYPGADGYGVYDFYDIGSKNTSQFGGKATRFGDVHKLLRSIAVCRRNGLGVMLDYVMHQLQGGRAGVYTYGSSTGTTNGRFPQTVTSFRGNPPRVPEDPVPSPADDFAFGDQLCPVNGIPKGYVAHGLREAGDWIFRRTGADGGRLDDMKGINSDFMKSWMGYGVLASKWWFGEYASGNTNDLGWYLSQVDGKMSVSDFAFHYNAAQAMANNLSGFNMGSLPGKGYNSYNPMKSVTWVESPDSDTNGFAGIVSNKVLPYALMTASEGFPQTYLRDYLRAVSCYGLEKWISNLVWCSRMLASGPTAIRWQSSTLYAFERTGGPGMLCVLHSDPFNSAWGQVTVQTSFGANVQIHDYSGGNPTDYWTDGNGRVTVWVPPGANGFGYGIWSRAGLSSAVPIAELATMQEFIGAADLDTPPLAAGGVEAGRIFSDVGKPISWDCSLPSSACAITVTGPDGKDVRHGAHATARGWHIVKAAPVGTLADATPYSVAMTYWGPHTITPGDIATDPVIPGFNA